MTDVYPNMAVQLSVEALRNYDNMDSLREGVRSGRIVCSRSENNSGQPDEAGQADEHTNYTAPTITSEEEGRMSAAELAASKLKDNSGNPVGANEMFGDKVYGSVPQFPLQMEIPFDDEEDDYVATSPEEHGGNDVPEEESDGPTVEEALDTPSEADEKLLGMSSKRPKPRSLFKRRKNPVPTPTAPQPHQLGTHEPGSRWKGPSAGGGKRKSNKTYKKKKKYGKATRTKSQKKITKKKTQRKISKRKKSKRSSRRMR
jgi:hypothetical protein